MKLFDIHESEQVLIEFDSSAKDAEFVKWVAASGKMREEVNDLLRVTKKIILRLNRDKKNYDKLYDTMKDMRRAQDYIQELLTEFADAAKQPEFLQDNMAFIELRKNIEDIFTSLGEIRSGEALETNPLFATVQGQLGEIEQRICGLETQIGQVHQDATSSDQQGILADVNDIYERLQW